MTLQQAHIQFDGFERSAGTVGIRNRVLVLPSVICSHIVAENIGEQIQNAVVAPHDHGCAQIGSDKEQTQRTYIGIGTNPNIAGVLVVGLGCEGLQSGDVAELLDQAGCAVKEISIQDVGGTDPCIEQGTQIAKELVSDAQTTGRVHADLSDLTVGIVASDCDSSSLDIADPIIGKAAKSVTEAGGRVLVAGSERVLPHRGALQSRLDATAQNQLEELYGRHEGNVSRTARVEEKARQVDFEALSRLWDDQPIDEIIPYGGTPNFKTGVGLLDAPSRFSEAATGLAAAGAQLVLHSTSEGIPAGHPLVPILKITGDEDTYAALPNDIDINANAASADDVLQAIGETANGEQTCTEKHGLTTFAITRVGPSM
ncbi:UxaA family hydrolase [Halalkalicoccus tibetensis]|uniref:UxaA family hydrolase n=1 Tax=Halalkalicoccus tibetensis TaxID=175632 RepID=A0ABD5V6U1_9EURY